ncbi:hypothetical protein JCM16418A_13330 [Paenibacillus pini]|uniref:Uncharacterized protein n=1 Tax=Paenibacillus pini JCM 16418 TaxID=1236976 RepID=W7Y9H6_9BACL|nr:hypothetical protein JCM16418_1673 [Paenibacillus pini JCM 16418]
MVQGIIQIGLTLLLGLSTELFSLQFVCLVFSTVSVILAGILFVTIIIPSKSHYFEETSKSIVISN